MEQCFKHCKGWICYLSGGIKFFYYWNATDPSKDAEIFVVQTHRPPIVDTRSLNSDLFSHKLNIWPKFITLPAISGKKVDFWSKNVGLYAKKSIGMPKKSSKILNFGCAGLILTDPTWPGRQIHFYLEVRSRLWRIENCTILVHSRNRGYQTH